MAKSNIKKKILFIFCLLSFFNISNICYSQDPSEFIKILTTEASNVLTVSLNDQEKIEKLRELAKNNVDIKAVGYYTLGKHRKNISKNDLEEYEKLFREYFLKSFSSRLLQYSDPKINVLSQEVLNKKYTMVSSVLVANDKRPEVKIEWRVYTKNPDKPLVRDLIIEGLSLARTQKEEFNSVIQGADGDIKVLFNNLREFIKK